MNYAIYMLMAVIVAPFVGKVDIVVSTSPQFFNGLAGYFVSRIKRVPWVLEVRDLWPESIVVLGALHDRKLLTRVLESLEKFVYRNADQIVSVTKSFKPHILSRGGSGDKVTVIRNGVDTSLFYPREKDSSFEEEIGVQGKFVAAYVGTHGLAHGLDTLLDAAVKLEHYEDIVLVMAGDGAQREQLQKRVHEEKIQNVRMLGQLSREKMPYLWSVTDVSLVVLRRLDLFKSVIPSKMFESMSMGKPIILGVEGEAKDILLSTGSGICIRPEDSSGLASGILELYEDRGTYRKYGASGRSSAISTFDRTVLAGIYLELLEKTHSES